jgi:hypothetical protein
VCLRNEQTSNPDAHKVFIEKQGQVGRVHVPSQKRTLACNPNSDELTIAPSLSPQWK